jgi:Berberine and berberine like
MTHARRVGLPETRSGEPGVGRRLYRAIFADSSGVPVPGDAYDGAPINHPDTDLADSILNTSGLPWPTIYYQTNYPRRQRVKQWDPLDAFHDALSVC